MAQVATSHGASGQGRWMSPIQGSHRHGQDLQSQMSEGLLPRSSTRRAGLVSRPASEREPSLPGGRP